MVCEFCGYEFDDACGRHGCPNCLGEGLMSEKENGESRRKMKVRDDIEAQIVSIQTRVSERESAIEADKAVLKTLVWVVGDGPLPDADA